MSNFATVGDCPICRQGQLFVTREIQTGRLYVSCEDCESEWDTPEASSSPNAATRDHYGRSEYVSIDELSEHPWFKFVQL